MTGGRNSLVPVRLPAVIPEAKKKRGGQTLYSEAVADEIVDRISEGETLRSVCMTDVYGEQREKGTFPTYSTIYCWADPDDRQAKPEFVQRFARACQIREHNLQDERLDTARNQEVGEEEVKQVSEQFGVSFKKTRKDMLAHRKLKIDTIDSYLARTNPQKWAERLQQPAREDTTITEHRIIIEGGLPDDDPIIDDDEPPPGSDYNPHTDGD